MSEDRERCLCAGMNDYLAKPFTPEELIRVLERFGGNAESKPVLLDPVINSTPEEPWISRLELLTRLDGDAELTEDLVQLYRSELAARVQQIGAAADDGQWTVVSAEAHSLKGASGNVCAKSIARLCGELEQCAANADSERCNILTSELKRLADKVLNETQQSDTTGGLDTSSPRADGENP